MVLAITLWFAGTTVIGLSVVLIIVLLRGIILGYTISAIVFTLGTFKGIKFCLISIFAQNILFIPAVLTLGVSSIRLYKSIIKEKDNIKANILRHTIISLIMSIVLILSSILENTVSLTMLKSSIKYF